MKADINYYKEIFGGGYSEEIISPYLEYAGDIIAAAAVGDELSPEQENAFCGAVCIQAEELARNGVSASAESADASACGGENYSSVRLGDFSVSFGSGDGSSCTKTQSDTEESVNGICKRAAAVLERYGLFYRGGVRI
ncbi:MAG: hypothetical protein NC120_09765 [Ruminococcus sp.]|nr:hypothetical protein [Ruminococcus sp.]